MRFAARAVGPGLALVVALAAGCSQGEYVLPEAETSSLSERTQAPSRKPAVSPPSGSPSAVATVSEPRLEPSPEPAPTRETGEVPPLDEQIEQCTRQTGMPQACEVKIRHGIP
ncbi:hypothetical protein [Streptomonospora alba]|nr:hypothetical protein [Streptomonospora alba]